MVGEAVVAERLICFGFPGTKAKTLFVHHRAESASDDRVVQNSVCSKLISALILLSYLNRIDVGYGGMMLVERVLLE